MIQTTTMEDSPTRATRPAERARITLPAARPAWGRPGASSWPTPRPGRSPEPAAEQLVQIGSELVTNAVLHARTELVLTLELRDHRVRISVKDSSRAPATLRHYRTDALTGRGLAVVAALSARWGISATPDGKVVWAELDPTGDHAAGIPGPPELDPASPEPPVRAPGTRRVRFAGVPVDGYLELQAHNDALFRELELISIQLETRRANRVASPLADLVEQLYSRFRGQRDSYRDVVAAAKARGERTVELETNVPPSSADAAWAYLELLERADELCRSGVLLTPEPPGHVRELRRWFVEQMATQLADGA